MLKIWTNHRFTSAENSELNSLRENLLGEHELFVFPPTENGTVGESAEKLQTADIAFGQPDPDAVLSAENIKWFHVDLAGYTPYDRTDFRENFRQQGRIMTNSSAVYVEPCSQHVLAMMMALARRLPESLDNQRGARSWTYDKTRNNSYLLNNQTALILGFGTIGRRLAELLAPLKMKLIGVKRTVRGDEPIRVVPQSETEKYLPEADHIINILPANQETINFLNAERLSKFKKGAIIYNIGRGITLDQDALLAEMQTGRIAAAYLDVTDPEPLPPAHPLWTTPNCYITPHSAGGFSLEKQRHVEHFLENLSRFEKGEDLLDRIY
ncbi:MAG TPA: D-2-hydroxyacid dehydrogenase [Pyrinomonadaceae bacterium]|nr:D-2-hydroxyacid dehydrogenase [Pyrinomonadaceae bacterium]